MKKTKKTSTGDALNAFAALSTAYSQRLARGDVSPVRSDSVNEDPNNPATNGGRECVKATTS